MTTAPFANTTVKSVHLTFPTCDTKSCFNDKSGHNVTLSCSCDAVCCSLPIAVLKRTHFPDLIIRKAVAVIDFRTNIPSKNYFN